MRPRPRASRGEEPASSPRNGATGDWAMREERYSALSKKIGLLYGARGACTIRAWPSTTTSRGRARPVGGTRGTTDFLTVLRAFNDDHPRRPRRCSRSTRRKPTRRAAPASSTTVVTVPEGEWSLRSRRRSPGRGGRSAACSRRPSLPPRPGVGAGQPGHFFILPAEQSYPRAGRGQGWPRTTATAPGRSRSTSLIPAAADSFAWLAAQSAAGRAPAAALRLRLNVPRRGLGAPRGLFARGAGGGEAGAEVAQRDYRLFRAARIIVDTARPGGMDGRGGRGVHGHQVVAVAGHRRAEVLRFCAWPTQAESYLTGAVEIGRMRDRGVAGGAGPLQGSSTTALLAPVALRSAWWSARFSTDQQRVG